MTLAFVGGSAVAVMGALGVVAARTPVHGVLALLVHFVGLAMLFLTLSAEFLAVSQIIVYAGAVLVLFLFVISLLTARTRPVEGPADRLAYQGLMAAAAVTALTAGLLAAVGRLGGGAGGATGTAGPAVPAGADFGSLRAFGRALLVEFPFELEMVGLVLLVAAIGVMVLVGRRPVPEQAAEPGRARVSGDGYRQAAGVGAVAEPARERDLARGGERR